MPPMLYQVRTLMPRAFKRTRRSYLKSMNLKLHVALSLVWGLIYWDVVGQVSTRLTDFVGAVFFVVAHWSWTPLFQGLGNFPREKEMLTKDRASKVYNITALFFTQVLAEAPLLLVFPAVFFAIIWPMAALPLQVLAQVFITANIQVCSSLSMLISALCMEEQAAITTAIIAMVFEMCAGGYFADMRLLPWWIGWVRYTSVYYYTFGASLRLLLAVPYGEATHQQATAKYSFSELGYGWEMLALALMAAVFRALALAQLFLTRNLKFS